MSDRGWPCTTSGLLARGTREAIPVAHLERDSGAIHIALAVAGGLVFLLSAVFLGAAGALYSQDASACQAQPAASNVADTIPATYLALYQQAGHDYGIPWNVLAGIGEVESDHGRSTAPGGHSGSNFAGAAGPMQFGIGGLAGDTWGGAPVHSASLDTGGYGIDGDRDSLVNVYDPGDAIPSAAGFLKANGAPGNLQAALFAFNHSDAYVSTVLNWAGRYVSDGAQMAAAVQNPACKQGGPGALPAGIAGKVIAYAEAQIGRPYVWGATGPDAFDCSGLTMMAYRAAGITIPRTSQQQWAYGPRVPAGQEQPGDLVFFVGSDGTPSAPGHVGIVMNNGLMIDSPTEGETVKTEAYQLPDLVGFMRP
jgi:cell wall-associated NlpC family hydrolase